MQIDAQRVTNADDKAYHDYLQSLSVQLKSFADAGYKLFTTDLEDLNEIYLGSFVGEQRQFHNCSTCRNFLNRFGSIAVITDEGEVKSPLWIEASAPVEYRDAVRRMAAAVSKAKVTGVFLSKDEVLGTAMAGGWAHLHVTQPASLRHRPLTLTAGQAMAAKREDYKNLMHALSVINKGVVNTALTVLRSDALYRSEKVLGAAEFLYNLHAVAEQHKDSRKVRNLRWRLIASAPDGFCHPRSSMIGTLIEDIEAGMSLDTVSRRFKTKMDPLAYQRPQAAPAAGAIAAAEKIVEQMGIQKSFARRYARLDEVQALWRQPDEAPKKGAGFFGVLNDKPLTQGSTDAITAGSITWEKFARTVLPHATKIEVKIQPTAAYMAILTASDPEAPPILQWDSEEQRNPFSWYFQGRGGSSALQWNLTPYKWVNSPAVVLRPHMWYSDKFAHQGKGATFVLEGARDKNNNDAALFPEIMKSELHPIRSVIEAYSHRTSVDGLEEGNANGIDAIGAVIRVTSNGVAALYKIDRWD